MRERTIAALNLKPGDAVLDVACGTGLSLPLLVAGVGPTGRVAGVELSPAMAAKARQRIARAGWANVALIEAAAEKAALPGRFDALLFSFTHDVLQSPLALANLFAAARPGARIAVSGSKLLPFWLEPANVLVRRINAPYLTTYEGLRRPWQRLLAYAPDLSIRAALWGAAYVAHGRYVPPPAEGAQTAAPESA